MEELINESYFKLKYIPSMVRDILKLDQKKKKYCFSDLHV